KLAFGTNPFDPKAERVEPDAFVLKVPASLDLELPSKAFPLAGKGDVTFTAEYRLSRSRPGATSVRIGDGKDQQAARPLLDPDHPAAKEYAASAAAFCRLFPNRFFYVDDTRGLSAGFHLIEGFFRDDQPLCRSVLSDADRRELDRL